MTRGAWRFAGVGAALAVLGAGPAGAPAPPVPAVTRPDAGAVPIVYSRCVRTEAEVAVAGRVVVQGAAREARVTLGHADVLDVLPDVTHFFSGFAAPCDLVVRSAAGEERVLYDCTRRSSEAAACAALDAAVSFDARTVAFAVFRGPIRRQRLSVPPKFLDPKASNGEPIAVTLPNPYLQSHEAQLHLVDVATGAVTPLPHSPGVFDSGPAWLSDGRLAFTSTRSGAFSTMVSPSQRPASQIFTMDPDGRNVEKASHHALAGEQHPLQLADGRLAFSSWQLFGMLPYRNDNGTPGGFGALENFFHVYSQHPDGANLFPLFGQHTLNLGPGPNGHPTHFAAHFLGQTSDGRLWTADYYRANNAGLGQIVGFPLPAPGQEGVGPDERPHVHDVYRPRGFTSATTWASGFDDFAHSMPSPSMTIPTYADPLAYRGKVSHPSGLPGNGLLVTWGVGPCSSVADGRQVANRPFTNGSGGYPAMYTLTLLGRDNPGCDAGIYRLSVIPSRHPSDLVPVVNRREYHEIMARPLVQYAAVHGVERPAVIPRAEAVAAGHRHLPSGAPFGLLGASSIILRETRSLRGHPFAGRPDRHLQWGLQGSDTVDYGDDELCGVRILVTQPSRAGEHKRYRTAVGERVVVLGEFPVRKPRGAGLLLDSTGVPDTSFLVRFPADTPYLMQAVDCLGRTLNTDQVWQHLRPGEVKTCDGCHVHGKPGLPFAGTAAARPDHEPVRLGEGTVPLLAGGDGPSPRVLSRPGWGLQFEYERDVFPLLRRHCGGCHGSGTPAAGLVLDARGTGPDSTYHRLVLDHAQRYVPRERRYPAPLRRPQLTRYVRALAARGSLLYWKAANQRTDGRRDDQYTAASPEGWNDVDFGPPHPTTMSAEDLGVLSRWIDTGAAAQAGFLLDTTPPALHLAAEVAAGRIVRLRVGTADVGTGVARDSLEVCVARRGEACGPNLAGPAAAAGVVDVALPAPLADPDLELRARVRDGAGNTTTLARTVRWLAARAVPGPR